MDVDFGQLYRYKTAEPYYIWKLRLQGQEQWKDVIFKDEGYLLDQRNFAKMCVRYLNKAPYHVSDNDWCNTLNSVLPNIIDVEVKQESDTSGTSMLKNAFIEYLSNKQSRRDCPFQINVGLCVRQESNGVAKYYFTHKGFTDYLRNQKISFDYSMLRETLKLFGAVEDTLTYLNSHDETINFPCWSKTEDTDIRSGYARAMEIEDGDKASLSVDGVSIVTNAPVKEKTEEEKPYTEEDMKNSQDLF